MLLVLGEAYQGMVTSFMTEKFTYHKFKTFDEVMQSDHKMLVGSHFDVLMHDNENYKSAMAAGRVEILIESEMFVDFQKLAAENYALVFTCDYSKYYIGQLVVARNYYMMDVQLFSFFKFFDAGVMNPFIDRLQNIMNRCYEAGLPQIWDVYFNIKNRVESTAVFFEVLGFQEVLPIFVILLFGNLLAIFVLILEIFYHDFLSQILLAVSWRRLNHKTVKLNNKNNIKRKKLRVRKIRVRPIIVKQSKS